MMLERVERGASSGGSSAPCRPQLKIERLFFAVLLIGMGVGLLSLAHATAPDYDASAFGSRPRMDKADCGLLIRDGLGVRVVFDHRRRARLGASLSDQPERLARVMVHAGSARFGGARLWAVQHDARLRVIPFVRGAWTDQDLRRAREQVFETAAMRELLSAGQMESLRAGRVVHTWPGSRGVAAVETTALVVLSVAAFVFAGRMLLTLLRRLIAVIRFVRVDPMHCAACGYDLQGLPESARTCPECGASRVAVVGPDGADA